MWAGRRRTAGYTLLEALIVTAILLAMVGLVSVKVYGRVRQSRLDRDAGRFARTLRVAAEEALLRQRDVAVVIDVYDGYYTVYEANEHNDYGEGVETLIAEQQLDYYWIDDISYSDGRHQYSGQVIITIAPTGWQSSILFQLIDRDDREYYMRCDQFTPRVICSREPLELPRPRKSVSLTAPL